MNQDVSDRLKPFLEERKKRSSWPREAPDFKSDKYLKQTDLKYGNWLLFMGRSDKVIEPLGNGCALFVDGDEFFMRPGPHQVIDAYPSSTPTEQICDKYVLEGHTSMGLTRSANAAKVVRSSLPNTLALPAYVVLNWQSKPFLVYARNTINPKGLESVDVQTEEFKRLYHEELKHSWDDPEKAYQVTLQILTIFRDRREAQALIESTLNLNQLTRSNTNSVDDS